MIKSTIWIFKHGSDFASKSIAADLEKRKHEQIKAFDKGFMSGFEHVTKNDTFRASNQGADQALQEYSKLDDNFWKRSGLAEPHHLNWNLPETWGTLGTYVGFEYAFLAETIPDIQIRGVHKNTFVMDHLRWLIGEYTHKIHTLDYEIRVPYLTRLLRFACQVGKHRLPKDFQGLRDFYDTLTGKIKDSPL